MVDRRRDDARREECDRTDRGLIVLCSFVHGWSDGEVVIPLSFDDHVE